MNKRIIQGVELMVIAKAHGELTNNGVGKVFEEEIQAIRSTAHWLELGGIK